MRCRDEIVPVVGAGHRASAVAESEVIPALDLLMEAVSMHHIY